MKAHDYHPRWTELHDELKVRELRVLAERAKYGAASQQAMDSLREALAKAEAALLIDDIRLGSPQ